MPETGRRTVIIRGQVADRQQPRRSGQPTRNTPYARTRSRNYERHRSRPDKVAMWAVVLGILLVFVAATSSHAAVFHRPAPAQTTPLTAAPIPAVLRTG